MADMTMASGYSFSMINFVRQIDQWNFTAVAKILQPIGTQRLELVPSMLLGLEWDSINDLENSDVLKIFTSLYQVTSIQSLTYGLDLILTDDIGANQAWQRRFKMLKLLGQTLSCHLFILGSPKQKKLDPGLGDLNAHQHQFQKNCMKMAELLFPQGVLCLEHNPYQQGAEYCNTLASTLEVVVELQSNGCKNIGINLDTKCLLCEFGEDVHLASLLSDLDLASQIKAIQVSLDFLDRDFSHAVEDLQALLAFARVHHIPISLEEYGLSPDQLGYFIRRWQEMCLSL
jgi:hypothetical protein